MEALFNNKVMIKDIESLKSPNGIILSSIHSNKIIESEVIEADKETPLKEGDIILRIKNDSDISYENYFIIDFENVIGVKRR